MYKNVKHIPICSYTEENGLLKKNWRMVEDPDYQGPDQTIQESIDIIERKIKWINFFMRMNQNESK